MKAITLWEPYATLVAIGAKPDETRSWKTNYRGPIAIHAARKNVFKTIIGLPDDVLKAMYDSLYKGYDIKSGVLRRLEAAQGHIVATAMLVECWKVVEHTPTAIILRQSNGIGEDKIPIDAPYLMFGDYRVDRYIWGLADVCKLSEPIPAKGKQGLWNWEGAL